MLYQIYETQRALMSPFAEFASASAKLYDHPLSPFAQGPLAQRISAGFDLLHRLAKDYEKPPFGITAATVGGVEIAVQEQVALQKPFCRLLRFKRFTDDSKALDTMKEQPTVLVVAPLSGHHATLLRDTVKSLLHDHKVYITDWTDARMVPLSEGAFHLDDYVEYVQEFIRHCGPRVHVISVCQPTVPVLAAVSLMASRGETTPLTMTMMGGPIDARKSPTAVNNLATNKSHSWFENNVIFRVPGNFPGAGRRVYPGNWEKEHTGAVVEQVVRPTGLVDPEVEVRPATTQVDDVLQEIRERVKINERVLVTTLTKRMAEQLTEYLSDNGVKVRYLHSDIDTVERVEILRDLRLGMFDVLVGINLLREGLDLPEVSLVAILDADKEGFLRAERSLIQTIGRAARNLNGRAILYADRMTDSMKAAIGETERRRTKQIAHNLALGITPKSVQTRIRDMIDGAVSDKSAKDDLKAAQAAAEVEGMSEKDLGKRIKLLEKQMLEHARNLEFEKAARVRDQLALLREQAFGGSGHDVVPLIPAANLKGAA